MEASYERRLRLFKLFLMAVTTLFITAIEVVYYVRGLPLVDAAGGWVVATAGALLLMEFGFRIPVTMRKRLQQEVGARERAEEELRESEARHRSLFDRVPVGLYRTTPDGQIVDANPALIQMLGYRNLDALLEMNAASIHASPEQRERENAVLRCEGIARGFELQMRKRDGTLIWAKDTVRAICDDAGTVLHYEGSMEDITERKWAEQERERLIRELQKALSEVMMLSGLLPICSVCKKIRDDQGYWQQVEEYIGAHSEAEFTHGICPECARKLYPEIFQDS